jgi:hypothetical protein
VECDLLDLSMLTAEYGRQILPCKSCVSTAMPLCNWPCSCYPNHAMKRVNDWMAEIYPCWTAALAQHAAGPRVDEHGLLLAERHLDGLMIITPVNWYQAPASSSDDRPGLRRRGTLDPTRTRGKMPEEAPPRREPGVRRHWAFRTQREALALDVVSP